MQDELILQRAEDLVTEGRAISLRPPDEQYMTGSPRIQAEPYAAWRSRSLALLRSVLGSDHTYVRDFVEATNLATNDPFKEHRDAGVGVLTAFNSDLADGYLTDVRNLLSAELFSDFLAMAQHLVDEGYHHAAASVAGAVLEDSLRRALAVGSAKVTGNLESMNQVALDKGVYGPLAFTQVKVRIAIRNDADHGNWDKVEAQRVLAMVRDIPSFLRVDLRLG